MNHATRRDNGRGCFHVLVLPMRSIATRLIYRVIRGDSRANKERTHSYIDIMIILL